MQNTQHDEQTKIFGLQIMAQNSGELSTSGRVSVETVRRESADEIEDSDAYTEISAAVDERWIID